MEKELRRFDFLINRNKSMFRFSISAILWDIMFLLQSSVPLGTYFHTVDGVADIEIYLFPHYKASTQLGLDLEKAICESIEHETLHHALRWVEFEYGNETPTRKAQMIINKGKVFITGKHWSKE